MYALCASCQHVQMLSNFNFNELKKEKEKKRTIKMSHLKREVIAHPTLTIVN